MWILIPTSVLSLLCFWSLWKSRNSAPIKVVWTFVTAVPILGAILYGACYQPPSSTTTNPRGITNATMNAAMFLP